MSVLDQGVIYTWESISGISWGKTQVADWLQKFSDIPSSTCADILQDFHTVKDSVLAPKEKEGNKSGSKAAPLIVHVIVHSCSS